MTFNLLFPLPILWKTISALKKLICAGFGEILSFSETSVFPKVTIPSYQSRHFDSISIMMIFVHDIMQSIINERQNIFAFVPSLSFYNQFLFD